MTSGGRLDPSSTKRLFGSRNIQSTILELSENIPVMCIDKPRCGTVATLPSMAHFAVKPTGLIGKDRLPTSTGTLVRSAATMPRNCGGRVTAQPGCNTSTGGSSRILDLPTGGGMSQRALTRCGEGGPSYLTARIKLAGFDAAAMRKDEASSCSTWPSIAVGDLGGALYGRAGSVGNPFGEDAGRLRVLSGSKTRTSAPSDMLLLADAEVAAFWDGTVIVGRPSRSGGLARLTGRLPIGVHPLRGTAGCASCFEGRTNDVGRRISCSWRNCGRGSSSV